MKTPLALLSQSSSSSTSATRLLCLLLLLTDVRSAASHAGSPRPRPQISNHSAEHGTDGASAHASHSSLPGELCPNRPFADARNDVIRYPMCLRQPGWNAAAAAAAAVASAATHSTSQTVIVESGDGVDTASTATVTATATATGWETDMAELQPSASSSPVSGGAQEHHQQQQQPHVMVEEEQDDIESPLDNSNFLSFEEWREQNLAKIGQSTDSVARYANRKDARPRRPPNIRNNLESIGDEGEIDLDFGGFASEIAASSTWNRPRQTPAKDVAANADLAHTSGADRQTDMEEHFQPGLTKRKNAGVTCKERSNYASFDCAATVLRTNRECSGSSAVLVENKDSYMLNECRAQNKFIILELCDDILIDTIVLANFEFFSSRFKTFKVSVSDIYPPKPDKWKELGVFEALNTREIQAFPVENPLIWARYVKIEFLTHYGNEFYCPLSLIRVHGTTMMEEFKNEGDNARSEDTIEDQEAIMSEMEPEGITVMDGKAENTTLTNEEESLRQPSALEEIEIILPESAEDLQFPSIDEPGDFCGTRGSEIERLLFHGFDDSDIKPICGMDDVPTPTSAESEYDMKTWQSQSTPGSESPGPAMTPSAGHGMPESAATSATATPTGTSSSSPTKDKTAKTTVVSAKSTAPEADDTASIVETVKTAKFSSQQSPHVSASSLAPASPSPTTQESFFKSMNKRLQMLETNSTLSLLYIGEQSRILREAFNKVEKRQLGKTTAFLENLNHTVLTELHDFRQQYDQVWQSVIMEFEQQRVQYNREVFAVTRQLGVLADEILFQKRLSLIQSIFLLILFGIMIFSRGPVRRYLELPPRVQGMLGRGGSPMLRSSWQRSPFSFPLRSPSQSPLSVPGSPVSDAMVHEQGAEPGLGPEQLVERAEIRHRKSSSIDSQDSEISMSPEPENEAYPVSDRSHSPPGSVALSSPPSSVRFERDLDANQKGDACMPNGHMIDTPESSELLPTEMVADTAVRRALSEVDGNRQRFTHDKEGVSL